MKYKKNAGQSLVEFAITLPLLLLLVVGVFDLGRVIYYYSAVLNAAREGARYGAVNHCDSTGIRNQTKLLTAGLNIRDGDIDIQKIPNTGDPEYIIVSVEYPFETVTPLVGVFIGESFTLNGAARQVIELPNCPASY
jgi:Flp pilus assembly protein TadG